MAESLGLTPEHYVQWKVSNGTSDFLMQYSRNAHNNLWHPVWWHSADAMVWSHTEMSDVSILCKISEGEEHFMGNCYEVHNDEILI